MYNWFQYPKDEDFVGTQKKVEQKKKAVHSPVRKVSRPKPLTQKKKKQEIGDTIAPEASDVGKTT